MAKEMTLEEIVHEMPDPPFPVHRDECERLIRAGYEAGFRDGIEENNDPAGNAHALRLEYQRGYEAGKRDGVDCESALFRVYIGEQCK